MINGICIDDRVEGPLENFNVTNGVFIIIKICVVLDGDLRDLFGEDQLAVLLFDVYDAVIVEGLKPIPEFVGAFFCGKPIHSAKRVFGY